MNRFARTATIVALAACAMMQGKGELALSTVFAAGRSLTVLLKTIETTPHSAGLEIDTAKHSWREFEPGSASNVFNTKSGTYITIGAGNDVVTVLQDAGGSRVGELDGMNPELVQEGQTGNGKSDETGNALGWTADKSTQS